jgi:hypothetical protein
VVEVSGWQSRGREAQAQVDGIVCHHTATPKSAKGDYPTLNVVKNGYSGLPGPLSHFGLGRSGTIYVIAAGRCNHNAPSTSSYHTNSRSIGIEAENSGASNDPWPQVQKLAYAALVGELCREFDLPVSRVKGHKEVNRAKNDPTFDMGAFREDVTDYLNGNATSMGDDDMVGLSKGDKGERVKYLQVILMGAGGKLPKYGADGDYGDEVEKAVIAVRRSEGSEQDFGDRITGWAAAQIMQAFVQNQAK